MHEVGMELLEKLPIVDTAAPRIGFTMIETINKIYEEYAKPIRIGLFHPVLPKKVDGISTGFNYSLGIGMYDSYKFAKFKVKDLILVCMILKREKTSKTKKSSRDYRVQCMGTNNTVDIYDTPFEFDIRSKSTIIYNGHIHKSNLPGLEQGSIVTTVCNALIAYFQPEAFERIDAAHITCKNGDKFYLSWLRLLTKPTDTSDLSWYNSFGLKRASPYVSNKKRVADTIDRIKHITAKELEEYYEKVNDLFSSKKYKSVTVNEYIPNGYFIYIDNNNLNYSPHLYFNKNPQEMYKKAYEIVKQEIPSATFTEILQKGSCEERASLLGTMPYTANPYSGNRGYEGVFPGFAGFHDTELKKEAVFPNLKDIVAMSKYMIWNNRKYTFKNSSKKRSITRKKKKKMKMEMA